MSESMITTVTHSKSGASCQIHPHGATILSFKAKDGVENLFVSRDAKLDGTKAIRGGIPLVFPIFGPPSHGDMPQHGFARVNPWTMVPDSMYDHDEVAGVKFALNLENVKAGRGITDSAWTVEQAKTDGTDCHLELEIIVSATSLTTTLKCQNTGTDAFDFQMLLHTYYKAEAPHTSCKIHGLGGYSIVDKVHPDKSGKVQSFDDDVVLDPDNAIDTDKVYIHPEDQPTLHVSIKMGSSRTLKLEAMGQVDETPAPVSCVVWNPGKGKAEAMSDFGNDQYKEMICVEPGLLGHQAVLNPGKKARLTQIITVE